MLDQVSHPLSSPEELRQEWPLSLPGKAFVEESRSTLRAILEGKDPRLLVILGPCSLFDLDGARAFADKLQKISSDNLFFIMRAYFEKPRTICGWKGLLHDPHHDGSYAVEEGMRLTRQFLLELIARGIPAACEFLNPVSAFYFGDLITWGCIGARTTASQVHRQIASGLPMPIGFKNSIEGNVDIAIHSLISAANPHHYIGMDASGKLAINHTSGNPDVHLVLRGGSYGPNYSPTAINAALQGLRAHNLPQRLIVDCSHDNSGKCPEKQPFVFRSVLEQRNPHVRGVMLESYLESARNVSLTDACLDWDSTEALLMEESHEAILATSGY